MRKDAVRAMTVLNEKKRIGGKIKIGGAPDDFILGDSRPQSSRGRGAKRGRRGSGPRGGSQSAEGRSKK